MKQINWVEKEEAIEGFVGGVHVFSALNVGVFYLVCLKGALVFFAVGFLPVQYFDFMHEITTEASKFDEIAKALAQKQFIELQMRGRATLENTTSEKI